MPIPELKHIDPNELELHPVLEGFPDLTDDEYQALKASIAEQGIKVELRGVPLPSGKIGIYSGRHRRRAGIELQLPAVPVMVNGTDPKRLTEFVLDEVTTGRQLTKSGLVLLLFEKHPSLAANAPKRKPSGKGKKGSLAGKSGGGDSISTPAKDGEGKAGLAGNAGGGDSVSTPAGSGEGEESYRAVADRYKVPREYFHLLAKIRFGSNEGALKLPPAKPEEWAEVRRQIIAEQTPITRIFAGWNGKLATQGLKKAPVDYFSTCRTALVSVREAFKHWKKVPVAKRTEIIGLWQELQGLIPEDLQ